MIVKKELDRISPFTWKIEHEGRATGQDGHDGMLGPALPFHGTVLKRGMCDGVSIIKCERCTKSANNKNLVGPQSCHSGTVFRSVMKSEMLEVRRLCDLECRKMECAKCTEWLVGAGHDPRIVNNNVQKMKSMDEKFS